MTVICTYSQRSNSSNNSSHNTNSHTSVPPDKHYGMRSRAWTPLKYPKSALEDNAFFPLHKDVLFASVRELLILDGTLEPSSLQVSEKKVRYYCMEEEEEEAVLLAPRYKHHLEPDTWGEPEPTDHNHHHQHNHHQHAGEKPASLKRKKQPCTPGLKKRIKVEHLVEEADDEHVLEEKEEVEEVTGGGESATHLSMKNDDEGAETLPCAAEEIANRIVMRARIFGSENNSKRHNKLPNTPPQPHTPPPPIAVDDERPPRKISVSSEYDHLSDSAAAAAVAVETPVALYPAGSGPSVDVSSFVNLAERNADGSFTFMVPPNQLPNMLETSISSEAVLRDATLTMTIQLVQSFSDASLRLFLGYKATAIARNRLICMLAGFLFDNSHAMFAWEQTEQEYLVRNNQNPPQAVMTGLDTVIQKSLFDARALAKIGGFHLSSLLPHAISIARQRRRKTTWEFFATTAKGKRMLDHHTKGEASVMSVGKRRRGQRMRHRHWLTSSLLWNEHHQCEPQPPSSSSPPATTTNTTTNTTPPSNQKQPCPVASSFEYRDGTVHQVCEPSRSTRRTQLLADMPNAMSLVLKKTHPTNSWGVGLVKEGIMCVVGKVRATLSEQDRTKELVCGDLILHVRNERGEEACSPTCAVPSHPSQQAQDWYRAIVDLFRTSEELHLIVQRV